MTRADETLPSGRPGCLLNPPAPQPIWRFSRDGRCARVCAVLRFALTTFIGAFLLFQVQPLIGKYILPWYGGGPGVWSTCLLFFQAVLVAGYAYAHATTRWFPPRIQALIHVLLLAMALALLPIIPPDAWRPQGGENPAGHILLLLAATVGLPYFLLATTGPLLQAWYSHTHGGAAPYRLYALSNAASLLALITYPVWFEAHLPRRTQALLWGWGLLLYAIGAASCAWRFMRTRPDPADPNPFSAPAGAGVALDQGAPLAGCQGCQSPRRPPAIARLLWLLLPLCASALLLAVTNKLCLDVAVVPFLWIAPLSLYLLSFVICFDSPRWYRRGPFAVLLTAALAAIVWAMFQGSEWPVWRQAAVYCGGLFVCCMVCHGELYRLRPEPARLTSYYLTLAVGGALGGLFVAIIAPWLFRDFFELHWALLGCALLAAALWSVPKAREPQPGSAGPNPAPWRQRPIPRFLGRVLRSRGLRILGLGAGVIGLGTALWRESAESRETALYHSRNFYGVLAVEEYEPEDLDSRYILLQHGRITHGLQFLDPEKACWPVSYYGPRSGIGVLMNALPPGPRRIGVVGLGTGTLTTYAARGDSVRFYEINPDVLTVASTYFSYLTNCPATVTVVLGDARLSLEREPPQQFDLLALDAFSSDAIPVHLLTREAFEIYGRHLKTNGVLAVHISNHFLDLEPVVAALARHFGYAAATIDCDENDEEWWDYASTWMLLSRDRALLESSPIQTAANPPATNSLQLPLWTDDYASVFRILK